jgi:hypothetical protein
MRALPPATCAIAPIMLHKTIIRRLMKMKTKKYITIELSLKLIIPIWVLLSICAWFIFGGTKYFSTDHDTVYLISTIFCSLLAGAIGFFVINGLISSKIEKQNKILEDEYYSLFQKTVFEATANGKDAHEEIKKMINNFTDRYSLSVANFIKLSEKALKRNGK